MAAKSIVDIDVNDEQFQTFIEKFNEYRKALDDLPEQWRAASQLIGDSAKETERVRNGTESVARAFSEGVEAIAAINDGLNRLNGNLERAGETQSDFNNNISASRNFLNRASKDAQTLAGHIKEATASLFSWGKILGLFSGVTGFGALWGVNRLAGSASAQRFTSLGLGTTAGGLNASAVNYRSALSDPVGALGAIRDSQLDLSRRWQFKAMGIDNPNQDPAKLLPQMIRSARDIFVRHGSTQQGAEAYGLTDYFSLDDLNRFKNMSDAEIDAMEKQAQKDAQRLQLTDQQLKQWSDFNTQLDRSKVSIGNTFIRGLAPLAPSLTKLSDAVTDAVQAFLDSPLISQWIDNAAIAIKDFGTYLSSPSFKEDAEAFMQRVGQLARAIGRVVDWIAGEKKITLDDVKSQSSILSGKAVTDAKTGETYVPGSHDDPRVWSWLKALTGSSGSGSSQKGEAGATLNFMKGSFEGVRGAFSRGEISPVDAAPPDVSAKGRTIADRFNNPGNLRYSPGYETASTKSGKFAVFPSLDEGVIAAARQLQIYGKRGIDNIHDIIHKWAPTNENNTKEYIQHVVKMTGVSEHEKLNLGDSQLLAKLISAMSVKEGAGSRVSEDKVIRIFNNTGGNAIVSSTQLGGF